MYKKFFLLSCLVINCAVIAADNTSSVSDADLKKREAHDYAIDKAKRRFDRMILTSKVHGSTDYDKTTYAAYIGIKKRKDRKQIDIVVSPTHPTDDQTVALCFNQKENPFTVKQKTSSQEKFKEFQHHFNLLETHQQQLLPEDTDDQVTFSAVWKLIQDRNLSAFYDAAKLLFPNKTDLKINPKSTSDKADGKSNH